MPRGRTPREYILYLVDESVAAARVAMSEPEWRAPVSATVAAVLTRAARYFPIVQRMRWTRPIVGTRVVLPQTEHDDARPTLIWRDAEMFFSILSGKVTTCIDAAERIATAIEDPGVVVESGPALTAVSNRHATSHRLAKHGHGTTI
jgi:hypothetical protein